MIPGFDAKKLAAIAEPLTIGNVPAGLETLLLAELARTGEPVAYVMSDGHRMADLEQMLGFVAPDIPETQATPPPPKPRKPHRP